MRRIVRDEILATKYKEWHDGLVDDNHPKYNSSKGEHYYSIVANLFWLQEGLCAYTETLLFNKATVAPERWEEGQYPKFTFKGQLDHFDPTLKTNNGWRWSNFFMIDSDINTKAKGQKVIHLLKPDNPDFDPDYYLNYNVNEAMFFPNIERSEEERKLILKDISSLGLNFDSIVFLRKKFLSPLLVDITTGHKTIEEVQECVCQYFTAFRMSARQI